MADIDDIVGDRVELARSLFAQATMLLEDTHSIGADEPGSTNTLVMIVKAASELQKAATDLASISVAITERACQEDETDNWQEYHVRLDFRGRQSVDGCVPGVSRPGWAQALWAIMPWGFAG
jgi:hypothetical protein